MLLFLCVVVVGDIQKVNAVAKRHDRVFEQLDQTIIFSGKGHRPLPDLLAGGDLDGDEYFIIEEPSIVTSIQCQEARPYSTPSNSIRSKVDMSRAFSARSEKKSVPRSKDMLVVFRKYVQLLSHNV